MSEPGGVLRGDRLAGEFCGVGVCGAEVAADQTDVGGRDEGWRGVEGASLSRAVSYGDRDIVAMGGH